MTENELVNKVTDSPITFFDFSISISTELMEATRHTTNSYIFINNPYDRLVRDCNNRIYYIIHSRGTNKYFTQFPALVDADYPGTAFITLWKRINGNDLIIPDGAIECELTMVIYNPIAASKHRKEPLALNKTYRIPLIKCSICDEKNGPDTMNKDTLKVFRMYKSTGGANGLDLVFEKGVTIFSRGIVNFRLNRFLIYREIELSPFMFLLRSRYSRQGISLKYAPISENEIEFLLENLSTNTIDLGNRFLQYVPAPMHQELPSQLLIAHNNDAVNNDSCGFLMDQEEKPRQPKEGEIWFL